MGGTCSTHRRCEKYLQNFSKENSKQIILWICTGSCTRKNNIKIIIIIIIFMKIKECFLFLDPQDEVGPSISFSVVLRSFVPLVYTVVLVLAVYLCPSSIRVVATFSGTVLFPLLCSVLPFSPLIHWFFSLSSFVIPSNCLKNFICAASKRCSSLFLSTQTSLPNINGALAVMLWILNFVYLFICFPKCLRIAPLILL